MKGLIDYGDAMILGFLARGSGDEDNLISNLTAGAPTNIGRAIIILRNKRKRAKNIPEECYEAAQALIKNVERQRQMAQRDELRRKAGRELELAAEKIGKKYQIGIQLITYRVDDVEHGR